MNPFNSKSMSLKSTQKTRGDGDFVRNNLARIGARRCEVCTDRRGCRQARASRLFWLHPFNRVLGCYMANGV
jgi:hypothetical protein